MDELGRGLGRTARAAHYAQLARTLRKAFIAHYWDASKGHFTQGSISSENALAIAFDMYGSRYESGWLGLGSHAGSGTNSLNR